MADQHEQEMRQQLSCSVCLDLYTDPYLLPCLHSLCRHCVQSLITSEIKECPECKRNFTTKANGSKLKRNFPLNNLVEIYKQSMKASTRISVNQVQTSRVYPTIASLRDTGQNVSSVQQTTHPTQQTIQPTQQTTLSASRPSIQRQCSTCDSGSTSPAEVYCQECTMSFCQSCLESLHPKDTNHAIVSATDVDKIQRCVLCESSATVRCVECQMTFCQQCLASYHPTVTSSPGHTLVEANTEGSRLHQQSQSEHALSPQGQTRSSAQGGTSGSRIFSSLEIARDVSAATKDRHCSLCSTGREASHRCLDCSISICKLCLYYHRQDAPSHTLINISLPKQQEQQQEQQQQHQQRQSFSLGEQNQQQQQQQKHQHSGQQSQLQPPTPAPNNDIQMKLVELMEMKADVLEELLKALRNRSSSEA